KGSRKTPEGFTRGEVPNPNRATVQQPRSPATATPNATAPVVHQRGPPNNLTCHLGSPPVGGHAPSPKWAQPKTPVHTPWEVNPGRTSTSHRNEFDSPA